MLQPCLLDCSNTLQRCRQSPCSCGWVARSECSRCGHTCQNFHSPRIYRLEKMQHCTLALYVWNNFVLKSIIFNWIWIPCQSMNTGSSLYIPESDCWIKTGRSKNLIIEIINTVSSTNVSYQVHVGIVCPGTSGTPLDGVDLLLMSLQVVNTVVSVHGPHLESHVVTAGGQELALRIPFDSVHLISVSLKNSIFYNKKIFLTLI